ncbi:MAG: 3-deoxy-7-phosphoheptulonate synthase class II [Actinomycetota bacterium]|nr:3-deoxy-7-phosphoheptulonate synthase class II [Actinomycetota bacterium]
MTSTWTPQSWNDRPAAQQPEWPDASELAGALDELRKLPPLVFAGEARRLTNSLARASRGEAFVLQAGECAEAFGEFSADDIRDKLKIILQMAIVLTYGAGLPVIKIGRIAGQFAKPRSSPTESANGQSLPSFRGHAVNDAIFDAEARRADPNRMVRAYHQSAATLNLLRAFTKGGFADLRQIHVWNQEFVANSPQGRRYEQIALQIDRSMRFMAACGVDLSRDPVLHEVDFYTSHEALLLEFEEALTRKDSITGEWYCCSAHMLWVGERTRQLDGAHLEFMSGVRNPIACKLGPGATTDEVVEICERMDPERVPGRLTLIARMGSTQVEEKLPPLIRAARSTGRAPLWICDPMHGNTFTTKSGLKSRRFDDILGEIKGFFSVHAQEGTVPGGVHLELTNEDVTECLGGSAGTEELDDDHLVERYRALCDPRLNAQQSLELAFELGEMLQS